MNFKDIMAFVRKGYPRISGRTVRYDLQLLTDLKIVELDAEKHSYRLPRLKTLSSSDYKLAMEHSRNLLFTDDEHQGFDNSNPDRWLDILLDHKKHVNSKELDCVMEHLKTGYYEEFWLMLQEYDKMKKEVQSKELVCKAIKTKKDLIDIFAVIMEIVKSGAPLEGACICCPTRNISIRN